MKKILFFLILTTIFLAGCTINFGSSEVPAVAGVFKSFDSGNTWIERNLFLYSGGAASISGLGVNNLMFDPQDNQAIYLASNGAGLLYSYDSANSWMKANRIKDGTINSVAIDPKNKCVIYITFANTILKSVDCNRSWSEIYIDTRASKAITSLAVSHDNNLIVYAGNVDGDILKSYDGGDNWQVIKRLGNRVTKMLIDPANSNIIYIATKANGIFKTIDGGTSWSNINEGLKPFSGSLEYRNLIFDQSQPDALLLVAKYGLIRTIDGGQTWQPIKLITPPASTDIHSVAINPQNSNEIYYATASTFYKTVDGGQTWITKRLPTRAIASYLLIDPLEPNIIYMGLYVPAK